jgi:glycerol-3-phosphate dehydrogenase
VNRDLSKFQSEEFDLLVIGGGIYGACICWEAASRGLSVALFEKADFGSATSANSLKIIHGGFRYLQKADFFRMRQSIQERKTLMRIAPHLVHPLQVLVPIYGHGLKGKEVFSIGLLMNDLIGLDRNHLMNPGKHIPNGRILSSNECLGLVPGVAEGRLSAGAIFYDAQVYNSERLVLAFLQSAYKHGAQIANYAEVTGFIIENERVKGVHITDNLTDERFTVHSKLVLNASGPWITNVLKMVDSDRVWPISRLVKAINLVTRPLFDGYAVGFQGINVYENGEPLENIKNGYLFIAPWRNHSLVGTAYTPYTRPPDEFQISEKDIRFLQDEINRAYPHARLKRDEITFSHGGMLPSSSIERKNPETQLRRHYRIIDHRRDGYEGLISVEGVKYTTARDVAEKAIDQVFTIKGYQTSRSHTKNSKLFGGEIEHFEDFLNKAQNSSPHGLRADLIQNLVYNYGSAFPEVLNYLDEKSENSSRLPQDLALLKAQIRYAIDREMAEKLGDIVFRRTELGSAGNPGEVMLNFCAEVMGKVLNWNGVRIRQELDEVHRAFTPEVV